MNRNVLPHFMLDGGGGNPAARRRGNEPRVRGEEAGGGRGRTHDSGNHRK